MNEAGRKAAQRDIKKFSETAIENPDYVRVKFAFMATWRAVTANYKLVNSYYTYDATRSIIKSRVLRMIEFNQFDYYHDKAVQDAMRDLDLSYSETVKAFLLKQ